MAELDELGDEPNFDLFGSFGLDFFRDDELLLTEANLTEQTETTEQTEHFHRRNQAVSEYSYQKIEANCKITIFFVVE